MKDVLKSKAMLTPLILGNAVNEADYAIQFERKAA